MEGEGEFDLQTSSCWGLEEEEVTDRYYHKTYSRKDKLKKPANTDTEESLMAKNATDQSCKASLKSVEDRLTRGVLNAGITRIDSYSCDRCEFSTSDFMAFIGHKNEHYKTRKATSLFTCGMCAFATPFPDKMARHINLSHGTREPILIKDEPEIKCDEDLAYKDDLQTDSFVVVKELGKPLVNIKPSKTIFTSSQDSDEQVQGQKQEDQQPSMTESDQNEKCQSDLDLTTVAPEALIGCLQPRKVRKTESHQTTPQQQNRNHKQRKDSAPSEELIQGEEQRHTLNSVSTGTETTACQTSTRSTNVTAETLLPARKKKVRLLKMVHHGRISVKFFTDGSNVIVTDSECPSIDPIDEQNPEIATNIESANVISKTSSSVHDQSRSNESIVTFTSDVNGNYLMDTDSQTSLYLNGNASKESFPATTVMSSVENVLKSYRKPKKDILNRYEHEQLFAKRNETSSDAIGKAIGARQEDARGGRQEDASVGKDKDCQIEQQSGKFRSESHKLGVSFREVRSEQTKRPAVSKPPLNNNDSQHNGDVLVDKALTKEMPIQPATMERDQDKFARLKTTLQISIKKLRLNKQVAAMRSVISESKPKRKLKSIRHTKLKIYKCQLCKFGAKSKDDLFAHTNQCHSEEEEMYLCDTCEYITSRQSKLVAHKKTHAPTEAEKEKDVSVGKATIAGTMNSNFQEGEVIVLSSSSESTLSKSETMVATSTEPNNQVISQPQAFSCTYCSYKSKTKSNIAVHERTHLGTQNKFHCRQCPYKTRLFKMFCRHQELYHQPGTGYIHCHGCDDKFEDRLRLKRHHLTTHTNKIRYACELCSFESLRPSQLKRHVKKTHSGAATMKTTPKTVQSALGCHTKSLPGPVHNNHLFPKPFKCVICKFAASSPAILRRHMPLHAKKGDKEFMCERCSFSTHVKSMLTRHIRHKCDYRFIQP